MITKTETKVVVLTQAQFDARQTAGTLAEGVEYKIIGEAESAANKVTSISSSSTDTQYPSAKCVYDEVSTISTNKADKVASATSGNFAGLNSSGNLTDSGYDATDFITTDNSVLSNPVSINADTLNNHPDTYFATAS